MRPWACGAVTRRRKSECWSACSFVALHGVARHHHRACGRWQVRTRWIPLRRRTKRRDPPPVRPRVLGRCCGCRRRLRVEMLLAAMTLEEKLGLDLYVVPAAGEGSRGADEHDPSATASRRSWAFRCYARPMPTWASPIIRNSAKGDTATARSPRRTWRSPRPSIKACLRAAR